MNIDEVYTFVQNLANKEQKGFLPSAKFNSYAERAQIEVFMQRYGNPHQYQPGRPIPQMSFESTQKISDDLRPFLKPTILNLDSTGRVSFPSDFVHPSALRYVVNLNDGTSTEVPVEVVTDDKVGYRLSSSIVAPNKSNPICAMYDDHIKFYPANLAIVNLTYLRQPVVPKWAFTIVSNREVYDASNSVDFEFPDEVHNEISIKILSYLAIKLRDQELVQYAETKNVQGI